MKIDVIATTISGSIKDWGKTKKIIPLFKQFGMSDVTLYEVDSHKKARETATQCLKKGCRIIISAGGSGTFNSVLEGCLDSKINLNEMYLGFLRKGSADLIGKVLNMPDEIEPAVKVFVDSIKSNKTINCDIIAAKSETGNDVTRHFLGYGGAEIFGEIPSITENRFMKYYKGILSQVFGDMGPFFVGASISGIKKAIKSPFSGKRKWKIFVDEKEVSSGHFQAFIIVNGDLGKNLPLAKTKALGSGEFYVFSIQNKGILKLPNQFKNTWNASVLENPEKWGLKSFTIKNSLRLKPDTQDSFNVNIDGSAMVCKKSVNFHICNQIKLISGK